MANIITVWGNPGSGKSVFCCILAKTLTQHKQKALIISADTLTPMLPVWLPEQPPEAGRSITQLIVSEQIDAAQLSRYVSLLKNYPFIGVSGCNTGENPHNASSFTYDAALRLIAAAAKLVDYVICDCGSVPSNPFMPAAIEAGSTVIRIITPDLRGLHYLKAMQASLSDPRFRFDVHLTFAGLARPFHAIEEIGKLIGGFDGLLPYSKEIERCAVENGIFQTIKYCHPKYTESLTKTVEAIRRAEPDFKL